MLLLRFAAILAGFLKTANPFGPTRVATSSSAADETNRGSAALAAIERPSRYPEGHMAQVIPLFPGVRTPHIDSAPELPMTR